MPYTFLSVHFHLAVSIRRCELSLTLFVMVDHTSWQTRLMWIRHWNYSCIQLNLPELKHVPRFWFSSRFTSLSQILDALLLHGLKHRDVVSCHPVLLKLRLLKTWKARTLVKYHMVLYYSELLVHGFRSSSSAVGHCTHMWYYISHITYKADCHLHPSGVISLRYKASLYCRISEKFRRTTNKRPIFIVLAGHFNVVRVCAFALVIVGR